MTDLKELIEQETDQYLEWPTVDKSHVTTVSAKLFAEHVATLYADHIPAGKMVAPAVQDEQYPPCDFCGVIPDHHPWHGCGMFKGVDSPHIHACNDCRHLLPSRTAQTEHQPAPNAPTFHLGDHVRKTKGSQWKGRVVGTYSTSLTPEGYAVESDTEKGSVQIYPVGALELVAAHRKQHEGQP